MTRGFPGRGGLRRGGIALAVALVTASAGAAQTADGDAEAAAYRVVGRFGVWEVRRVERPGTAPFCMARTGRDDRFAALYAPAPDRLRLQFYSEDWSLGEGGRIALAAEVDGGSPWALGDATAFRQSVLFDLPQSRAGAEFLQAVMRGSVLSVSGARGGRFGRYSLRGSGAAVAALADCVRALQAGLR